MATTQLDALVDELERSYAETQDRMSDPSVYNDYREAAEVGRRLKELEGPHRLAQEWKGDLPSGSGTFTAGDTISGGYTFKSRFEDGPGSNPEQLIAAAHASCFSMALSHGLAQAGHAPEELKTSATVTFQPPEGITKIALEVVGKVPGIEDEAFQQAAQAAKENCPVSKALAGIPDVSLDASLA